LIDIYDKKNKKLFPTFKFMNFFYSFVKPFGYVLFFYFLFSQLCPRFDIWGPWSICSVTCGRGLRSRTRLCLGGDVGQPGCNGDLIGAEDCVRGV